MTPGTGQRPLRNALRRLQQLGVMPGAAARLDDGIDELGPELRRVILDEIPAFTESGNPHVLPELEQHAKAHIEEIRRLFSGAVSGDFAFVRSHAQRRASQRFPLEAVLHAYRCGHKVLLGWMRDAATGSSDADVDKVVSAVADFAVEYTNAVSTIAAADYVATVRRLAEAEGDRRTELLNALLVGYDESDGRVARALKRAGYLEQRQAFCVAVAQSIDPREMENAARAQRIVESINAAVDKLRFRTLAGVRESLVTAVISDTRRLSGWTAPQTALSDRILPQLLTLGPSVIIGLSADHPSTSHIPRALREARTALDLASVTNRVVPYSQLPIRQLIVHQAGDSVRTALPQWTANLLDADRKSRGALVDTLRAFADADMNVLGSARLLDVHPNTVYTRLKRISRLTGLDAQQYHALTELLLAIDCGGGARDS